MSPDTAGLPYRAVNRSVASFLSTQAQMIEERIEAFLDFEDVPVKNHIVERRLPDPTALRIDAGSPEGGSDENRTWQRRENRLFDEFFFSPDGLVAVVHSATRRCCSCS